MRQAGERVAAYATLSLSSLALWHAMRQISLAKEEQPQAYEGELSHEDAATARDKAHKDLQSGHHSVDDFVGTIDEIARREVKD